MSPTASNTPNYNFPKIKFCCKGHAIIGDNIRQRGLLVRCRTCCKATQTRRRHNPVLPEAIIRCVVDELKAGRTLNNLAGYIGDTYVGGKVVDGTRLRLWCKANPKLGRWILKTGAENGRKANSEESRSRRVTVAAPALVRSMSVLDAIDASLTMWLDPATERPDIIADMWLAVAQGRLLPGDIKNQARKFVANHRKMYPNTGRYGFNSLDAPAYDDNPLPRIERVAAGDGLWS
jgi:hypothetical protein